MPKSKLSQITTNELQNIVENSSSLEEVLKNIGYKKQFNNNKILELKKECEKRNIDYSHLVLPENQKKCLQCGQVKPIDEFYDKRHICKECTKLNERNKYQSFKEQLNNYKKQQRCAKCGCDKFYVLDFHHIDPKEKDFTIAESTRAKFETIKTELDKCIVLCSNCHREFHYLNEHYNINLNEYLDGYSSG